MALVARDAQLAPLWASCTAAQPVSRLSVNHAKPQDSLTM
jgi:hypothetical protein